ncbi:MAG: Gfo/Idh/MocA family oxidoreductase [Sterolibacterium sp.]|nr:Gfo/Idh/MocA family oxidoreductase [Sterolibacterium sp.]
MKWRSAVVGLGRIGMGYDFDQPIFTDDTVLTHAAAFAAHPEFDLVGGVDPDIGKRGAFTRKYGVPAFADINGLIAASAPQVLALAIPTAGHGAALKQALTAQPRLVICEKPLASDLATAQAMVDSAERKSVTLLVNYMRRFDPGIAEARTLIRDGSLGTIFKGTVWYSKGLINNGSHFLDLLAYLLGDATGKAQIISAGIPLADNDPQPDFKITFGNTEIVFLAAREECYSLGEIDLLGSAGRLTLRDFGQRIETRLKVADPQFPGYHTLETEGRQIKSGLARYQWHVVSAAADWLANRRSDLPSTGVTALATQKTIASIIDTLGADIRD